MWLLSIDYSKINVIIILKILLINVKIK